MKSGMAIRRGYVGRLVTSGSRRCRDSASSWTDDSTARGLNSTRWQQPARLHCLDRCGSRLLRRFPPELVLLGIAARGPALVDRGEPLPGEAGRLGVDRLDVLDLDAEVVQRSALSGILEQDELERGLGDRTVRVAGTALGRLSAEQPCV